MRRNSKQASLCMFRRSGYPFARKNMHQRKNDSHFRRKSHGRDLIGNGCSGRRNKFRRPMFVRDFNPSEETAMSRLSLAGSILAATLLSSAAFAQTPTTPTPPAATKADAGPKLASPHWRSSKLIGVKIFNEQNERLGDVNEIILDPAGKVMGYVIGVGGFLGMGEHDILVEPGKIKFVNDPPRTAAAPANTTKTDPALNTRPASNAPARAANEQWYPDHGVLSATKDQLKAMPQFKYSSYN